MKIYETKERLVIDNNINAKKTVHISNDVLINMCSKVKNQNADIYTRATRSNPNGFNRGDLCEQLAKTILKENGFNLVNNACGSNSCDLNTMKCDKQLLESVGLPKSSNIEIKFSTSYANATKKDNKARWVLLFNSVGAFLVESKNLVTDSKGHITPNQKGVYLDKLSEMVGY